MFKNTYFIGLLLFVATMLVFFSVYYFFNGVNYYNNSLIANAFALPVLYCGAAFLSVHYLWKRKKLNFREAFQRAFTPMFVGGLLSVISIFAFLNFVDPGAKDILNHQFVERNRQELTEIYTKEKARLKSEEEKAALEKDYQRSLRSFSEDQVKGKDMLTFNHFAIYFAAILLFYVILSFFFGAFFRTKSLE